MNQRIGERVGAWRAAGYPCEEYPAIGEMLEWSRDPETEALRYLRAPQFRALEVYWYLRLIAGTPRIPDLYRAMFTRQTELLDAMGLKGEPLRSIVCPRESTRCPRSSISGARGHAWRSAWLPEPRPAAREAAPQFMHHKRGVQGRQPKSVQIRHG